MRSPFFVRRKRPAGLEKLKTQGAGVLEFMES